MQRAGHLWRTRSEHVESLEDQASIRRVLEAAFETDAEADHVDELRQDAVSWIPRYSVLGMTAAIPDSEFETMPAAHALIHRCTVGGGPRSEERRVGKVRCVRTECGCDRTR